MYKKEIFPASLLFLFILSMLLQDLVLQQYLGTITKSPVVFVAPILFLTILALQRSVQINSLVKYYLIYWFASIAIALCLLLFTILFITNGNLYVYTEYMPLKLVRASIYNLTYFFSIYILVALTNILSVEAIYQIIKALLLFLILYGILQILFNFRIEFINATPNYETRIALTASEPSNAAPMFTTIACTFLALRFYLNKKTFTTILYIFLIFFILIFIASKGALLLLPISFILAIRKRINFKIILIAIAVITPLVIVIAQIVIPALLSDIENFNSFSTRVTSLVAAAKSFLYYPFGEGYGTYLVYYPPMLLPTNQQLSSLTGLPFLDGELRDMVETGKNLPAKSGIANEIIYNGVAAITFLFFVCRHFSKKLALLKNGPSKIILSFLGIFLLITFLFTSALETAYYYLIPLVLVGKLSTRQFKEIVKE